MKVAINIRPLYSGHKLRGIGYYTESLLKALEKDEDINVVRFSNLKELKDIDLVHYPWFDFYFHSLPIRKRSPTVVTVHDVIPLIFKDKYPPGIKGSLKFFLQKLALKRTTAIITDSKASKGDIQKYLYIKEEKISVIPLAVDEDFKILGGTKLLFIKREYNLPDEFLLYVGDVNWTKNIPFLIKGFHKITQNPALSEVKLVLVGSPFLKKVDNINHPELEPLKKVNNLIKELNLESKIIRVGDIDKDQLVAFYNLATLYTQPSLYEGFGLPVLEALTCGTPVVSSNRGSLPEVGGDAVVYFDPENLDQFTKIVIEILQNKSLQNKLSKLAIKQSEKFSWEKVAEQTKSVYSKVIKDA